MTLSSKKFFLKGGFALLLALGVFAFASCNNGGDDDDDDTVTYSVIYVSEYGETPAKISVEENTVLTASQLPELSVSGYTFGGWYDGSAKTEAGSYKVTADVALIAKWTAEISVTADTAASAIQAITEAGTYTVKLTGAITSDTIIALRAALRSLTNDGADATIFINLDLSETTGLTALGDIDDGDNAARLAGIDSLLSLTLPEGLVSIGWNAIRNNKNLKTIVFPSTLQTLGRNSLRYCFSLTHATLPSNLKTIDRYAFYDDPLINIGELPSSLTTIGNNAFKYCKRIKPADLVIPDSVTSLGSSVFEEAYLDSVVIGQGITTIPYSAFKGADIIELTIPAAVTTIESKAFDDNYYLKTINYGGTKAQWEAITKDTNWYSISDDASDEEANYDGITVKCSDGTITLTAE